MHSPSVALKDRFLCCTLLIGPDAFIVHTGTPHAGIQMEYKWFTGRLQRFLFGRVKTTNNLKP